MSVKAAWASISEKGTVNGIAGDSTGNEVKTGAWYNMPANYVAIYPDESVREKIATQMKAAADNNNIGYGQSDRNTLYTQVKSTKDCAKVTVKCNCDCSSLANVACYCAGVASYGSNGWTTSTMKSALKTAGFKIVTTSSYITNEKYAVKGAIYVKEGSHTIVAIENGSAYSEMLTKAGITTGTSSGTTKEVVATGKAYSFDKNIAGQYKVANCSAVNIRDKASNTASILVAIPKDTKVMNYGYYTVEGNKRWYYIQVTYKNVKYTGFINSSYLKLA